jgi:hypothetical protein
MDSSRFCQIFLNNVFWKVETIKYSLYEIIVFYHHTHPLPTHEVVQWKRISRKQSARWQHLSRLKARALFFLQKNVSCMKCNNLYFGLVTPSCG